MTQKETLANLSSEIESLKSSFASLEKKVEDTVKPEPVVEPVAGPNPANVETPVETVSMPKYPIPPDFIDTVDLVLNKNFGVELEALPDSAGFLFSIIVPEKYSSITPAQKEMNGGKDIRPKVITFADGVNGVRLWAERVFNNLDKDTQFRVVEDRPFANRPI